MVENLESRVLAEPEMGLEAKLMVYLGRRKNLGGAIFSSSVRCLSIFAVVVLDLDSVIFSGLAPIPGSPGSPGRPGSPSIRCLSIFEAVALVLALESVIFSE